MLEGLYSAAAGMAAQQRRVEALSNDVANVSTTGYKRVRVAFRDLAYTPAGQGSDPRVERGAGAAAAVVGRGFSQGALRTTDRPLDVAIAGPGFFRVRGPDGGVALTRDGSLRPDATGTLVTSSGARLEPPVRLPRGANAEEAQIAADGSVRVGGRLAGRIEVVTVRAPEGLQSVGDNLFRPTAASGAMAAAGAGTRLAGGTLEASNVELSDALVDMMDAQRGFSLASKAIQMQDEMLGVANGVKR